MKMSIGYRIQNGRDGILAKSTDWSSRGHRLDSKTSHICYQLSVTSVLGDMTPSSSLHRHYMHVVTDIPADKHT